MRSHPPDRVARALAYAFLAGPWEQRALLDAGRRTLGPGHRWLNRLTREVLSSYRDAPRDRPGELADMLRATGVWEHAFEIAAQSDRPIRVRAIAVAPTRMGAHRWPVPIVDDVTDLARLLDVPLDQLTWLVDHQGRQTRTPAGPHHAYRYRWVARPGRTPRLIEAPTPLLRAVLRRALDRILDRIPVHPAASGFVRGRSALTHAEQHVGSAVVVSADLRHFFAAITRSRVRGLMAMAGYPEPVAAALAALFTTRTPGWVLRQAPPGGTDSDRYRLRAGLRTPHLAQGAPTSPALANLACYLLDVRLTGYVAALDPQAHYSRYADDLTFSGSETLRARVPQLLRGVGRIVDAEGFGLSAGKTRTELAGARQRVTGIIVNTRCGVPREDHDRLRAVLHEALTRRPDVANRSADPGFRARLDGQVGWVEFVNPVRGARLRAAYAQIDWSDPLSARAPSE